MPGVRLPVAPAWALGAGALAALILPVQENGALALVALALAGLGASAAGSLWRLRGQRRLRGHVDPASGVLSREGLGVLGEDLLDACRRDRQPAAMVAFDCDDLAEVRHVYGSAVARALFRRLVERLSAVAGRSGLVARTGPTRFAVLLPGHDRDAAARAVRQALGRPSRIEYDGRDSEIVLVPDFVVDELGDDAGDIPELLALLEGRLLRLRDWEERRQKRLRRSRERYTSAPQPLGRIDGGPMPEAAPAAMPSVA